MEEKIKNVLDKLSKSKFRSGFHLKDKDVLYIKDKGIDKIREHAYDFISRRIADTSSVTDGKQTPMRGHPVFIAEHATATCCRGCLSKWYHIDKNRCLTKQEIDEIVDTIMVWIYNEMQQ